MLSRSTVPRALFVPILALVLTAGCGGCDDDTGGGDVGDASSDVVDTADSRDTSDDAADTNDGADSTDTSACDSPCDQPPDPTCDQDVVVDYVGEGTCDESTGECDFSAAEVRTDCSQSGLTCSGGTCVNSACSGVDCSGNGTCLPTNDQALCECDAGYVRVGLTECLETSEAGACGSEPCTDDNREICRNDSTATEGYVCECNPGYSLVSGVCQPRSCSGAVVRTETTLFDQTPLPDETEPVRNGFDPLLQDDSVRVHVDVKRMSGSGNLSVSVFLANLEFTAGSLLVNGQASTPSSTTTSTITVDLPAGDADVSFEATVASATGIVSVDASVSDDGGCEVPRSSSGVRLQVAGDIDPKGGGCLDMADYAALQITPDIPEKNTSVYDTRNGESTIYPGFKVLHQVTLCLRRSDARTVSLAGSADGTRPWMVDNVLLIETFDGNPEVNGQRTGAYLSIPRQTPYPSDATLSDGTPVEVVNIASISGEYAGGLSPSPFTHPAGVVQLDEYMPAGDNVWIRFTGLDSGVEGRLSRIFLHSAELGENVPACVTHFDCAEPDVDQYGGSWATAGGCIDGACAQNSCTGTDDCPVGQRCAAGFCTGGCDDNSDCPTGLTCEGRFCVDVSADGCADYTDCPAGEVCQFSRCTAGCFHPRQQQADYSENYSSGFCANNPDGCPRCGTASDTCWNNYCRDCEIDAHCGSGEDCVQFECVP